MGINQILLTRIVAIVTLVLIGEVITTTAITLRLIATTILRPTTMPTIPSVHSNAKSR
jgi:hypothetical protein